MGGKLCCASQTPVVVVICHGASTTRVGVTLESIATAGQLLECCRLHSPVELPPAPASHLTCDMAQLRPWERIPEVGSSMTVQPVGVAVFVLPLCASRPAPRRLRVAHCGTGRSVDVRQRQFWRAGRFAEWAADALQLQQPERVSGLEALLRARGRTRFSLLVYEGPTRAVARLLKYNDPVGAYLQGPVRVLGPGLPSFGVMLYVQQLPLEKRRGGEAAGLSHHPMFEV